MSDERRGFIGGSDVAAILGLSPYGSPWSIWLEKTTGLTADRSDEMDERLQIGKDAERFLADVFNRHHADAEICVELGQVDLASQTYPWLRGHADGVVVGDGSAVYGWEAKTDRSFATWDEVPAYYQTQAQVYMMLSGYSHWWFTVGFAGWKVRHYVVAADAEDQALIAKATGEFWTQHVLTGTPPEVDGTNATTEAIRAAYNHADADDVLLADDEDHALVRSLRVHRADLKALEGTVAELENRLKVRMADCAELRYGDQTLVTWRPSTSRRVDLDALRDAEPELVEAHTNTTTTRRFLVKSIKEK